MYTMHVLASKCDFCRIRKTKNMRRKLLIVDSCFSFSSSYLTTFFLTFVWIIKFWLGEVVRSYSDFWAGYWQS